MIVLSLLLLVAGAARLAARRPDLWLGVSLTTMMLPVAATRAWLGPLGPLATVPPATWLLLAGAATLLLDQRRMVRRGTWAWLGAVIGVVLVATGAEHLLHGTSSVTPLVVLWVLPMSGFVAVVAASTAHRTADPLTAVTPWLACLAVSESLLAIAQRLTGSGLVFEQYRSFAAQFSRTGRAPGTFDTPLDLAAFLTLALVVVVQGRRPWPTWTSTTIVAAGVLCTGSRTGIVVAVAVVAFGVAVRGSRRVADLVLAVSATIGAAFSVTSAAVQPLFARFGDRGDRSSWARDVAREEGLRLVESRPLAGHGLVYSYEYALANLPSSFENAWLTLAIGAGLPVTALLMAIPVAGWLVPGRPALLTRAMGALPLVWGASYSANTATNTFGVLASTFLGLATVALLRDRSRPARSGPPGGAPAPRGVEPGSGRSRSGAIRAS